MGLDYLRFAATPISLRSPRIPDSVWVTARVPG
jgi:hypothetical protein